MAKIPLLRTKPGELVEYYRRGKDVFAHVDYSNWSGIGPARRQYVFKFNGTDWTLVLPL